MAQKIKKCRKLRCYETAYLWGLCKEHYKEEEENERRRNDALETLRHATIEGRLPDHPELRDELLRLRKWWFRACDALNYQRTDDLLFEEAEYAMEWCINLTKEIITAELAFRKNQPMPFSLNIAREEVWSRFSNIEKGLMSNGVKRPAY